MKLNPDCIRDILFSVETNTDYDHGVKFSDIVDMLPQYEPNVVLYHLRQCELYGFFTSVQRNILSEGVIEDLSPKGHEFVQNIRTDTVWKKVKDAGKKAGSWSIGVLAKIAENQILSKLL